MYSQDDKVIHFIWEKYNHDMLNPTGQLPPVCTDNFITKLPKYLSAELDSSYSLVIQFGVATGTGIRKALTAKDRGIIGYDYSDSAMQGLKKNNIQSRKIDLNEIDPKSNSLAYFNQLKQDLQTPAHIFLIRILEYIRPEAMALLLLALRDQSQPGTRFYFENHYREKSGKIIPEAGIIFDYPVPYQLISSFFSPWPDFKNLHLQTLVGKENEAKDRYPTENSWTERFVIEKTTQSPYLDELIEFQTNTQLISKTAGVSFTAKLKPEYYVDAVLDITDHMPSQIDEVANKFTPFKIPHRICLFGSKKYLVVPNVNVQESVQGYITKL
jgi:hypothetical protein